MIRVTLACPQGLISEANQLMMILGNGPEDGKSFLYANWETDQGVAYCAASTMVGEEWIRRISFKLVRPEWDVEPYVIDLDAAERARYALVTLRAEEVSREALRDTDKIAVVVNMPGRSALNALGLKQIQAGGGD